MLVVIGRGNFNADRQGVGGGAADRGGSASSVDGGHAFEQATHYRRPPQSAPVSLFALGGRAACQ
jgi:hypothetical protein